MKRIGVLSLQGSVVEHRRALEQLANVEPVEVKTRSALQSVDALILPGGESTTISKLLHIFELFEPLCTRILEGLPVWGTCAGMILLAKEIVGEAPHLGVMDITVRRNAYGRQNESFTANALIPEISQQSLPLTFIRAPWAEQARGEARVLLALDEKIVAVRERNMLATAFHPELTANPAVHRYFASMMRES